MKYASGRRTPRHLRLFPPRRIGRDVPVIPEPRATRVLPKERVGDELATEDPRGGLLGHDEAPPTTVGGSMRAQFA